jgi:hypothetical protein
MIKINDIKPIVEIPDMSIYLYYIIITIVFLFIIFIGYFIYKFLTRDKNTIQKGYYKKLKDIDFENIKQTAYTISKYGQLLAKDDRQIQLISEIVSQLEPYKYKKEITTPISNDIRVKFDTFMETIDV